MRLWWILPVKSDAANTVWPNIVSWSIADFILPPKCIETSCSHGVHRHDARLREMMERAARGPPLAEEPRGARVGSRRAGA
jgi:hypothetical protein